MPEQEPVLNPQAESQRSLQKKAEELEAAKFQETQELTPEREAEIKALVAEIREEVAWYMKTPAYKQALENGDLKALEDSGYLEELEGEKEDYLAREDVKGDPRKELAVETLYEFLKVPVREIERTKRRSRKKELIERKKSFGLTEQEKRELRELSLQDTRLSLQDAELSNKIAQFLINNGYQDSKIVREFWQTFDELIIDPREKRKLRNGFLGPAALYYLTEYLDPQKYAFHFSEPQEDVFQGIDLYLVDKESGQKLAVQVKYCQECYAYEFERPQEVSVLEIRPGHEGAFPKRRALPGNLQKYEHSIARFARGILEVSAERQTREGLFVVIPGRLRRRDESSVFSIDKTTAKPTPDFLDWISQAF